MLHWWHNVSSRVVKDTMVVTNGLPNSSLCSQVLDLMVLLATPCVMVVAAALTYCTYCIRLSSVKPSSFFLHAHKGRDHIYVAMVSIQ